MDFLVLGCRHTSTQLVPARGAVCRGSNCGGSEIATCTTEGDSCCADLTSKTYGLNYGVLCALSDLALEYRDLACGQ